MALGDWIELSRQTMSLIQDPHDDGSLDGLLAVLDEHSAHTAEGPDRRRIADAFAFGRARNHGDESSVGVATICAGVMPDTAAICAALLYGVVSTETASVSEVRDQFGEEIAGLVESVTQFRNSRLPYLNTTMAENYRNMIVAMATDIRVIVMMLADDLIALRDARALQTSQQRAKAKESIAIYAPLAHRLGLHAIKWELEDRAFALLHPRKYRALADLVAEQRAERERYVTSAGGQLGKHLEAVGIQAEISGRAKHLYSIYSKMSRKGREFNEIYDLTAMRVVVDSEKDCYGAVAVAHAIWRPVPGRFKDMMVTPRPNLYRALHTTVVGPNDRLLEVQVRTREMDEWAVAQHWLYKEGREHRLRDQREAKLELLRSMLDGRRDEETLDALIDQAGDEVFVFTPHGELRTMRVGSTVLDFAYDIHTDIGHRCTGAKVSGKEVQLDHVIQSGDLVEVLTSPDHSGPSNDWLAIAKTERARKNIKARLAADRRKRLEREGRARLREAAAMAGLAATRITGSPPLADVIREMGFRKADDFYVALGADKISANVVVKKVHARVRPPRHRTATFSVEEVVAASERRWARRPTTSFGIRVDGLTEVRVRLARCCRPLLGDGIMGHLSLSRGVTIHRDDCPNAVVLRGDPDRVVGVSWEGENHTAFPAEIEVDAWDRGRLLEDLLRALAESGARITEVHVVVNEAIVNHRFVTTVNGGEAINGIVNRLRAIDSVLDVYRVLPAVDGPLPHRPRVRGHG